MNRKIEAAATRKRRLLTALTVLVALAGCAGIAVSAPPDGTTKVVRQIRIMEGIIDKVLLDSPNFLVHSGNNTHGLYISEYGAIFTFEASLTSGMFGMSKLNINIPQFEVQTNENGDKTIVLKGIEKKKEKEQQAEELAQKAKDAEKDAEPPQSPATPAPPSVAGSKEDENADSAQLYQKGKGELIQALLDYGETLTQLKSGQWIVIAAFLQNDTFFEKSKLSRLVVKAKIDDLRGFAEGNVDENTMRSRIVVEEY